MKSKCTGALASLLLAVCVPSGAAAQECGQALLERWNGQQIDYRVSWKGISLESRRTVNRGADGVWLARNDSRLLFMALEERSRFRYDAGLHSLEYVYQRKGMSKKRDLRLLFEQSTYRALSPRGNEQVAYQSPVYDLLNHQLQLQIDLACAPPRSLYSYPVARRDEVDAFEYRRVGTETVSTPAGSFEALRLERGDPARYVDRVWLAPALGYAIVRLERLEDDETAELVLTRHPDQASK